MTDVIDLNERRNVHKAAFAAAVGWFTAGEKERNAALVESVARAILAERERCAKVAEGPAQAWGDFPGGTIERDKIAAAIRSGARP